MGSSGQKQKPTGKGSPIDSSKKITANQYAGAKETGHSILNSVIASQIKKPPHRRSGSPVIWFPRTKTDSYLKRKIRLLQEDAGMGLSLDETLGNANPHYTRITREKIAAREAAMKAMEARKAAMVEASWCRILRAARIVNKEAIVELEKAEKTAADALEAAKAKGVMMYDHPDCPRRPCEVESSSTGGGSTHTVTASFETAFEVDKEVAEAVKKAFIQLANNPTSLNRKESKDLLWKISQNPYVAETDGEFAKTSSIVESDSGEDKGEGKQGYKCGQFLDSSSNDISKSSELVDTMLGRIKVLQEDELSSLATIVATCGLNAALHELVKSNNHDHDPLTSCTLDSTSKQGTGASRSSSIGYGNLNGKEPIMQVPSLDKILVKHVSKLEREVQEARNSRSQQTPGGSKIRSDSKGMSSDFASDLGSVFVKHVSKFEREIQEAKAQKKNTLIETGKISSQFRSVSCEKEREDLGTALPYLNKENIDSNMPVPSSDEKHQAQELTHESPVKHISRIERAKLESKEQPGLDEILVKPVHLTEKGKMQSSDRKNEYASQRNHRKQVPDVTDGEGLDKFLAKHVARLEKARAALRSKDSATAVKKQDNELQNIESLDEILVKHQSKLEKEKLAAAKEPVDIIVKHRKQVVDAAFTESLDKILIKHQPKMEKAKSTATEQTDDYTIRTSNSRREARQRELEKEWSGLSLESSVRPHHSRLELEKAAWKKAEAEEQMQAKQAR